MPKENTHLSFAKKILNNPKKASEIINKNIEYYYFGSIFPDTFYYSKNIKVEELSDYLHHGENNITNEVIIKLIKAAKDNKDEELLTFSMGYITHCCLDISFHPMIFYLTGNFYDNNISKREEARYKHRRMEVILDKYINKGFYYYKLINLQLLENNNFLKSLSNIFNTADKQIILASKKQQKLNKLFQNKYFAEILYFFYKIKIFKQKSKIALFYRKFCDDEKLELNGEIVYKDLFTGIEIRTNIDELFNNALTKSSFAIESIYKYYLNEVTEEEMRLNIPKENLDTGSKIFGLDEAKFFT